MHRVCDFFRSGARWAPIPACVGFGAHAAQVVPALYGAVVADTDGQLAAQDAMRQVLVCLTGERDAAGDPALAAARRAGAAAALIAQALPADPAAQQWTLVASSTDTRWTGGPELPIDGVTDTLLQAARSLDDAPEADFTCRISGAADLASFASVLTALRTAPEVTGVAVRAVDPDSLLLQLKARGNEAQLEHALANDRLRVVASNAHGELDYRYQAAP
jgi:hypothetical protein